MQPAGARSGGRVLVIPASGSGMPFLSPATHVHPQSPQLQVLGEAALLSVTPTAHGLGAPRPQPGGPAGWMPWEPPLPCAPAVPSLCLWGGCHVLGAVTRVSWPVFPTTHDPPHMQGSSRTPSPSAEAWRCPRPPPPTSLTLSFLWPRAALNSSRCPHSHGTHVPFLLGDEPGSQSQQSPGTPGLPPKDVAPAVAHPHPPQPDYPLSPGCALISPIFKRNSTWLTLSPTLRLFLFVGNRENSPGPQPALPLASPDS